MSEVREGMEREDMVQRLRGLLYECQCQLRGVTVAYSKHDLLAAIDKALDESLGAGGPPGDRLREFLLDDALHQAISTIEFMHGCLTEENFEYAYPEQTLRHLEEFRALASDRPPPCAHSNIRKGIEDGCESCKWHMGHLEARAALSASQWEGDDG